MFHRFAGSQMEWDGIAGLEGIAKYNVIRSRSIFPIKKGTCIFVRDGQALGGDRKIFSGNLGDERVDFDGVDCTFGVSFQKMMGDGVGTATEEEALFCSGSQAIQEGVRAGVGKNMIIVIADECSTVVTIINLEQAVMDRSDISPKILKVLFFIIF